MMRSSNPGSTTKKSKKSQKNSLSAAQKRWFRVKKNLGDAIANPLRGLSKLAKKPGGAKRKNGITPAAYARLCYHTCRQSSANEHRTPVDELRAPVPSRPRFPSKAWKRVRMKVMQGFVRKNILIPSAQLWTPDGSQTFCNADKSEAEAEKSRLAHEAEIEAEKARRVREAEEARRAHEAEIEAEKARRVREAEEARRDHEAAANKAGKVHRVRKALIAFAKLKNLVALVKLRSREAEEARRAHKATTKAEENHRARAAVIEAEELKRNFRVAVVLDDPRDCLPSPKLTNIPAEESAIPKWAPAFAGVGFGLGFGMAHLMNKKN